MYKAGAATAPPPVALMTANFNQPEELKMLEPGQ